MTVNISDIESIIAQENAWRQTQTINLIPAKILPARQCDEYSFLISWGAMPRGILTRAIK